MIKIATALLLATAITAVTAAGSGSGKHLPEGRQFLPPYPEHLTGTFTGGFGEETCRSCHFDYPLNYEEAKLRVTGVPDTYRRGDTYRFSIYLSRPQLGRAGFQLSARFEDGSQAGGFLIDGNRLRFTEASPDSLQFVQHSLAGTEVGENDSAAWTVRWRAPEDTRNVIIHLAANASNGDASEFGDFILQQTFTLQPVY